MDMSIYENTESGRMAKGVMSGVKTDMRGFTLIEVLLVVVIGSIISAALLMVVMAGQQAASGIEQKVSVQQDVRAALDMMAVEIGMASLNPNISKTGLVWLDATCSGPGVQINKGIQRAGASTLTVEMDLSQPNGNGNVTDENEMITYNYEDNIIRRSVSCGSEQTFIGGTNVEVINSETGAPVFRYFNGNGIETNIIPDIRQITITLIVRATTSDLKGATRTAVYSTSVFPKNHAISND
jgi:type IV pilus assembly protein PilW